MNKKIKIVSSLALAGMLVTGSLGLNKSFATDMTAVDNYTSNPIAVYRNLVEGKTVVPFLLANRNDVLTVKDIVENDMFKGKVESVDGGAVSALDKVIGTGDTFKTTDGTEYTVVLYGDVDGNGRVNSLDALKVEQIAVGEVVDATHLEAADVHNNARINSLDSLRIEKFAAELDNNIIDPIPALEEVEEDVSNYTIALQNATYINNTNVTAPVLFMDIKETLDANKNLTLVISDENQETDDVEQTIPVIAHTDYMNITVNSLASLTDGTLTITLKDGNTVLSTAKVQKNTQSVASSKVTTDRTSTRNATLSLESCGETEIAKVKYIVMPLNDNSGDLADGYTAPTEVSKLTNTVNATNGKITDAQIASNLQNNKAYKVFFVVENAYGSQSEIRSAIISSDSASVTAKKAVEEITYNKEENKFEWADPETNSTYTVTVYKDGIAVSEEEGVDTEEYSVTMDRTGKYKIAVVVEGANNGTSTDSKVTESEEVEVTVLSAVENFGFVIDEDGTIKLAWENANKAASFKEYEISIYTYNADGEKEVITMGTSSTDINGKVYVDETKKVEDGKLVNEAQVYGLKENTMYFATLKLVSNDEDTTILDSEEATSEEFYVIKAPSMTYAVRGTTSVTFPITPINIANKEVTYKVETYDVNTKADYTVVRYTLNENATKNVTQDENGNITIDGLTSLNTYAFRLVVTVDDTTVKSGFSSEIQTLPTIENMVVGTEAEASKENSGKVYADSTKLIINGADYSSVAELDDAQTIIDTLEKGDVITINNNKVTVDLAGNASVTSVAERDFGTVLSNKTLELKNNQYSKIIKGTFNTLILNGEGSIYDVSNVTITGNNSKMVVSDGVEVIGNKDYTVETDSTVIINDIKVTTAQNITITANGKTLNIPANANANDLVFENTSDGNATINFKGSDDYTSEQKGTITIISNGGKVTVLSDKVNVSASMNIEVNNGEVEITAPGLNGDKTVTVSANEGDKSVIIANTIISTPQVVKTYVETNGELALKEYSDEEIKEMFSVEQKDVAAISEYIDSFNLNGKDAYITNIDGNAITIEVNGNISNVEIGNIK